MPASKDRRITVKDDGASPATVLRSGAGKVRLSKAAEAAAASGHTMTLEEWKASQDG